MFDLQQFHQAFRENVTLYHPSQFYGFLKTEGKSGGARKEVNGAPARRKFKMQVNKYDHKQQTNMIMKCKQI